MAFAGDGGPPPESSGGGGKDDPMFSLYEEVQREFDGKVGAWNQRISNWFVDKGGKDKPIMMLDHVSAARFTCLLHIFKGPDGKMGSIIRCVSKAYPDKGCPICVALEKHKAKTNDKYLKIQGVWFWCLTGIDRSKWSPKEGKNKDVVYTGYRRLVLVTAQQYNDMESLEKKEPNGWRGRSFDVTRADSQTSYKIGTQWYPTNAGNAMSDDDLHEEFKERSGLYGLPVEQYCTAFDYDTLLPILTYEKAEEAAAKIVGAAAVPTGGSESISF